MDGVDQVDFFVEEARLPCIARQGDVGIAISNSGRSRLQKRLWSFLCGGEGIPRFFRLFRFLDQGFQLVKTLVGLIAEVMEFFD